MPTEFMLLIFDVNELLRRLTQGDLAVAEDLAAKARLLATIAEEASVHSRRLSPPADTM